MKSEHRHELKENELGRITVQAQSYLKTHGNQILLGLAGVAVVLIGVTLWRQMANASASAGWGEFVSASTPETYASLSDKFPKSSVGQWAKLNESEGYLGTGVQNSFMDRKGAMGDLEKAKKGFEEVLNGSPLTEEMRERALFGLARTLEITSGRDTEESIGVYEKLLNSFPDSTYKEIAQQRIEHLKSPKAQEFYAWFKAQDPKPEDRRKPQDGLPADHPPLDLKLPDFTPGEKSPEDSKDKPDGAETPAADKPAAEKPGEDKPADSKPETAKPEPEKPAKEADTPDSTGKEKAKPEDTKPEEKKPEENKADEKKPE